MALLKRSSFVFSALLHGSLLGALWGSSVLSTGRHDSAAQRVARVSSIPLPEVDERLEPVQDAEPPPALDPPPEEPLVPEESEQPPLPEAAPPRPAPPAPLPELDRALRFSAVRKPEAPPEPLPDLPPVQEPPDPERTLPPVEDPIPDPLSLVTFGPAPEYPRQAVRQRLTGEVVLVAWVSATGRVGSIEVEVSSGYLLLDDAAVAALSRWKFRPRAVRGEAQAYRVRIPFRFGAPAGR